MRCALMLSLTPKAEIGRNRDLDQPSGGFGALAFLAATFISVLFKSLDYEFLA